MSLSLSPAIGGTSYGFQEPRLVEPHPMPPDLSLLDTFALIGFFAVWVVYNTLFDGRFRRPGSINAKMIAVREAWMIELLDRENRITDATLIGHSIRSATFFASTTIILIAGLMGVLGSVEAVHTATVKLSMLSPGDSQAVIEAKLFVLIGILVYAFFKFTWAIRQFNYFSAVVGSAPLAGPAAAKRDRAHRMAMILSHAIWQINAGVRGYYFAFAVLGWFVHPFALIVLTVLMTVILVRRQLFSPTARAIADHVDCLADDARNCGGAAGPASVK
jgi:uncharacterized membrane protein